MKTYEIDYNGSAGPEDAEAGRTWDVIQIEDNVRTLFAQRCTDTDAKRIVECVNALEGIEDPAGFIRMQRDHVAAQHEALGVYADKIVDIHMKLNAVYDCLAWMSNMVDDQAEDGSELDRWADEASKLLGDRT